VDVRLLAYLENIQLKLEQQRAGGKAGKKGKGSKKGKKGSKKGKKGKKSKKGKKGSKKGGKKGGKKEKAIEGEKACAHMTLPDMIGILVKMGVLQQNTQTRPLKAFVGDMNYLGSAYQVRKRAQKIMSTQVHIHLLIHGHRQKRTHAPIHRFIHPLIKPS
jgi:hypothetical protein